MKKSLKKHDTFNTIVEDIIGLASGEITWDSLPCMNNDETEVTSVNPSAISTSGDKETTDYVAKLKAEIEEDLQYILTNVGSMPQDDNYAYQRGNIVTTLIDISNKTNGLASDIENSISIRNQNQQLNQFQVANPVQEIEI